MHTKYRLYITVEVVDGSKVITNFYHRHVTLSKTVKRILVVTSKKVGKNCGMVQITHITSGKNVSHRSYTHDNMYHNTSLEVHTFCHKLELWNSYLCRLSTLASMTV